MRTPVTLHWRVTVQTGAGDNTLVGNPLSIYNNKNSPHAHIIYGHYVLVIFDSTSKRKLSSCSGHWDLQVEHLQAWFWYI